MLDDLTLQRDAILGLACDWHAPAGSCPDDDRLVQWHEREADTNEHDDVADHVALCARCYSRWQTLLEVAPATVAANSQVDESWWSGVWATLTAPRRLPVFAVVASIVVVGFLMVFPDPSVLPDYQLSARGDAMMRSGLTISDTNQVTIGEGGRVSLLLTPAERYDVGVDTAIWHHDGTGLALLPDSRVQQSAAGAVRIDGPARAGVWHVIVALRGKLPSRTDVERVLSGAAVPDPGTWQRHSISVTLREYDAS